MLARAAHAHGAATAHQQNARNKEQILRVKFCFGVRSKINAVYRISDATTAAAVTRRNDVARASVAVINVAALANDGNGLLN